MTLPTARLEVRADRILSCLTWFAAFFFGALGLGVVLVRMKDGFGLSGLLLPALMVLVYGGVFWLVRRGHRRSVRCFTAEGVERHDGVKFAWPDLTGVVVQYRIMSFTHKTKQIWRVEIRFRSGGSAWLLPNRVGNWEEVEALVRELPCPHTEVQVGAA